MQQKLSLKDLVLIVYVGMSGHVHPRISVPNAGRILARQLETAFATASVVLLSSVLILGVFILTLMNHADAVVLGVWSAAVATALIALALLKFFYHADRSGDLARTRYWARAFELVSLFRALVWASGVILFFPGADPSVQMVLAPSFSSIMFGGAFGLSAVPATAIGFTVLLGGSAIVALIQDGTPYALALAAMTVGFIVYLLGAIVSQARFFITHVLAEIADAEQKQTIGLLLKEFQDNSSDWLWHTDPDGHFIDPSARFASAAGRSAAELKRLGFARLFALAPDGIGKNALARFDRHLSLSGEDVAVDNGGNRRIWSLSAGPRFDKDGGFLGYRGVASDVTELRAAAAQLQDLAHYDQLTGLLNRSSFISGLNRAIEEEGATGVGIVLFDLTGFKQVNDTLGHGVGDRLLAELGERLKRLNGPDRAFARLGGDEFALLIRAQPTRTMLANAAQEALSLIGAPYAIRPHNVMIDASAGIALGGCDGTSVAELMRAADLALYAAKSSCRGCWREYDEAMDAAYMRRQNLERALRMAIDNDELHLRFQPIVSVRTGTVSAFEALLRWDSAEFGAVRPDEFIPIAEESGMIVPIGDWVMRKAIEACTQLPGDTQICINVSPVQLRNREFFSCVEQVLDGCGLAPERLVIEITEGVFLERSAQTDTVLGELMALGVQVALDDFGTGYSSLSYLRSFPFSKIKIDKSFVEDAAMGGPNASIVKASVDLARAFGFEIVVEGVETNAQLQELIRLGCDYFQGYLFSKPLLETELPAYLDAMVANPPKKVSVDAA